MLRVEGLKKELGTFCLGEINLQVEQGEYFVLLGPSGAGKTLFLEVLAGFQQADAGRIYLNGRRIDGLSIQKRKIGYLCQGDTLFPHLRVRENISYGLRIRSLTPEVIRERVEATARETSTEGLLDRDPGGLSGGERQRVALARMLVLDPECLILDEPLAGLDEILKQDILGLLLELQARGRTFVHVTHDPQEAMAVATRVGVMEGGKIVQDSPISEFKTRPKCQFAARFAGIRNFFTVEVLSSGERGSADRGRVLVLPGNASVQVTAPTHLLVDSPRFMVIDESKISLYEKGRQYIPAQNRFEGVVKGIYPAHRGAVLIYVDIGFLVTVLGRDGLLLGKDDKVVVWWPDEAMRFYG